MPNQPNIILIFPDQWRGDCLGSLGHPSVETPWLDSLAQSGTTFTRAYSPTPSCVPARACLITGGSVNTTGRPGMEEGIPWQYPNTMMRCLRDGGYQTMLAGKTHFYPQMTTCGFEKMSQYEAKVVGDAPECDYHAWLERETGGKIRDTSDENDRNNWIVYPWTHEARLHPNTWTMDAALDLLRRRDPQRPYFLQVGFNRPHPPIDPPLHYLDRFNDVDVPPPCLGDWSDAFSDFRISGLPAPTEDQIVRARRAYYAQVAHIDEQIGRLLFHLRQSGEARNTWVVCSSDHGEMLGDHHHWGKQVPLEGSARVPLIIRSPLGADTSRDTKTDVPCNLSDLMPTFLDIAGIDCPDTVEGTSLLPATHGDAISGREWIHGEHAGTEGWQYLTDGKEKYFWESNSGREWCFDLASDPEECHNLIDDPASADRAQPWRARLIQLLHARGDHTLSDGTQLISGSILPRTRPHIKNR